MKKYLSTLLALSVLLSCFTHLSVFAEDEGGIFEPSAAPKKSGVPTGMYTVLDTDFSNATLATGKKTKLTVDGESSNPFSTVTDHVAVVDIDSNRLLRIGADDGKTHGPRVRFNLPENSKNYFADFLFAHSVGASLTVNLYQDKTEVFSKALPIIKTSDSSDGNWNSARLEMNLETGTFTISINNKVIATTEFALESFDNVELGLLCTQKNNAIVYLDNLCIYSKDKPVLSSMFVGKKIYWENVKPENELNKNSFVNNLVAHPRVLVYNWEEMREKINADYFTKKWYSSIKSEANRALRETPVEWKLNSRNNVLESARSAKIRLVSLAFIGMVEDDKNYLDRAYEEAIFYGTWPDWSGFNSTFVTAQILEGYACLYDWGYSYFSAEQKQALIKIMKKHAFPDFLYHYENMDGFDSTTSNWNPVCNEAMICAALAVADEEPLLAEYILQTAPLSVQKCLAGYSPEGAYAETVSYWNAGTMNLSFISWILDHAFREGFTRPSEYDLTSVPQLALTAEYPIYGHGPAGMFNFGDCVTGFQSSPAIYWAATTYDKPQYAWWANKMQTEHGAGFDGQYIIGALSFYDPEKTYYVPGAFELDKFYTAENYHNAAWLRSSWNDDTAVYAAMQGGPVGGHQHLSLGTYVIDYMGKRFIRNLNHYDYSLNFGDLTMAYYRRGEAYNTLIANPTRGEDIRKAGVAQQIANATSANTAFGVFDMTSTNADYADAKRGIMLTDNRRRIIVQDEVTAKKPSEFYWFANTDASVKIAPDGKSALLTIDGHNMLARIIKAPAEAKFALTERKSLFADVNNDIPGDEGEKLFLHFTDKTELEICVEYIALKDGEGIPAPWPYTKMENWRAEDNALRADAVAGSNVVLKLGTPNAIANGVKTLVDSTNAEVVPFTENGRTLVPVRFISEGFGAKVQWDDTTKTVTVTHLDKEIKLVIGSNEMKVNGETVLLDVPANTYNSRTLIPLRALAEALGMKVFWDDRGLISIGIVDADYTEAQIQTLINELDVRLLQNGRDVSFFSLSQSDYTVDLNNGESVPTFAVYANGNPIPVTQAQAIGERTNFTVHGQTYTILMQTNTFDGIIGNKDSGVLTSLAVTTEGNNKPAYDTFIYVEDLADSTNWEKYPKRGIVDGIINERTQNRWAAEGEGVWICVDFGSEKNVHSMAFAGVTQTSRAYKFDVQISSDNINWTTIHTGGAPATTEIMSIIPLGDVQARYVKLVGYGSNASLWNTYAEIRFYESAAQQAEDISYWPVYFTSGDLSGSAGTQLKVVLIGEDAYRNYAAIRPDAIVTYQTADANIATVSPDGIVTFVSAGETTMTVTVTQDGYRTEACIPLITK